MGVNAIKQLQWQLKADGMYQQRLAGFLKSAMDEPSYLIRKIRDDLFADDGRPDELLYLLALAEHDKSYLLRRALKAENLLPESDLSDVVAALRLNRAISYEEWFCYASMLGDDTEQRLKDYPLILFSVDEARNAPLDPLRKRGRIRRLKPR